MLRHKRLLVWFMTLYSTLWLFTPFSLTDQRSASPWAWAGRSSVTVTYAGRNPHLGHRITRSSIPRPSIEPYVRTQVNDYVRKLRPIIVRAAARHNHPDLSGMNNEEFAEVIALLIYNEHNGWLEDEVEMLRSVTPLYEDLQVRVNASGVGSDFSIWPSNLRPSVALEILRGQIPVPAPTSVITRPITVAGSQVVPDQYVSQRALLADITQEISRDTLAIEYLAANLERGLYRAHYEGVPVSWRVLAAWHNQGIVQPAQIRANASASDYIRRTTAYLPLAHQLIITRPGADRHCETGSLDCY